jgi:putative ABC transport system permease protein
MIRNYFKIALRHLQRNKLYAIVNISGLAIGILSCLLIGIYIRHELSFDRFHKHAARIVRVTWEYNFGDADNKTATTGTKVGPQFQRTFPEVESYVRTLKYPRIIEYNKQQFDEKNFLYADSAFFTLFSFPLIKGDPATALNAPEKLVISASMARKYFGNEDPMGKVVRVNASKDFTVSGIAADVPGNSQLQFDFVGSFKSLGASKEEKWNEANYITYLLLSQGSQIAVLQQKITAYAQKIAKEEMGSQENSYMNYNLEPLSSVHLHSKLDGFEPNGNIVYIYVLAIIAFLIMLIAGVNYTNLSTAQSAGRSAEIGMRKVLGAGKKQVFNQFICETFILTFLSMVLAVALTALLLPYFNQLSGKEFSRNVIFQPVVLLFLLVLVIIVSLTAGSYPALLLSNSKVIKVLKSGFHFTGSPTLRKSLIVLQFVISLFLIITTVVILQQLSYIQNKDLGYNKEQIVVLPADQKLIGQYDDFKNALKADPNIKAVAGAYEEPTHIGWGDGLRKGNGEDGESITINALPADEEIAKVLGLKIIAGEDYNWTDVQQFDTSNEGENIKYAFMLNEAAVKALGWTPQEAIGKVVSKGREGIVKAVVKDFHFRSLHESISPLAIFMDRRMVGSLFVKLNGNNVSATLASIEKVWKQRMPHRPFEYNFLDESYAALYKTEQRTATIFVTFSSIAIILACLGLFALTAYTMVQRTKEIGIRKILGATVTDILALVSKDFLRLVVIAFIIAAPIAFFAISRWLNDFTYKTAIYWWVFAIAGGATLFIALLTISLQAIKTALTNPIKNLRTE